jgi:two-component system, chemotaxis family, protein-glutamate methylesterase/glutaminase
MESKLVVIGGSAGSFRVILEIVETVPSDLPPAVMIVVHSPASQRSCLPGILTARCKLPVWLATDGDRIHTGEIYVCPPDRHLVVAPEQLHLSRGPKEGLHRPSINAAFRSAAMAYGDRVIGVLLSGMLDDGAAGMWETANHGGTTIIQDPEDATYPSMPLNALRDARVDYKADSHGIGPQIARLASGEIKPERNELSEDGGKPVFSGSTCPECRGPLSEIRQNGPPGFRCRVGHAFSLKTLLDEQTSTQERKLYEAIVALQEGAQLAEYAANRIKAADAEALRREAEQLRMQAETIRRIIEEHMVSTHD